METYVYSQKSGNPTIFTTQNNVKIKSRRKMIQKLTVVNVSKRRRNLKV